MPLTDIAASKYVDAKERQLLKNIMYVGVLTELLGIEPEVIAQLLGEQYKGKDRLIKPNLDAFMTGLHHARERLEDAIDLRVERRNAVGERIFIEGNAAAALGCVYGGATVCAWYPITPSSSLAEAFQKYCSKYRVDKATGKNKFAIVQAEDELASIGIVIGAGWNGARSFTATSGPGISLMSEFIGLAYFAEIPAVIIDVQRGGPSTGMPTRTQQSDLLSCAYASHGDTKHVLLFPEDPYECFEFSAAAFDLAERLQTPIFVMTDLDIGMNHRLCAPLAWDDSRRYDRGKVMTEAELEAGRDFGRYLDADGDGIPFRTLPGTHATRGAYFTRGTTKDCVRALFGGRSGLHLQHGATAEEVRDSGEARSAAGQCTCCAEDIAGCHLLRFDQPVDERSTCRAAASRRSFGSIARPRISVCAVGEAVHRRSRIRVRRRTES